MLSAPTENDIAETTRIMTAETVKMSSSSRDFLADHLRQLVHYNLTFIAQQPDRQVKEPNFTSKTMSAIHALIGIDRFKAVNVILGLAFEAPAIGCNEKPTGVRARNVFLIDALTIFELTPGFGFDSEAVKDASKRLLAQNATIDKMTETAKSELRIVASGRFGRPLELVAQNIR